MNGSFEIRERAHYRIKGEDTVLAATASSDTQLVYLLSSGKVVRYDANSHKAEILFTISEKGLHYTDGGFDLSAPSRIYTMDSIVVVVNSYKLHGYIHYPDYYHKLHLWRKDYHADISHYPIALYKDSLDVPHIIYSEAWNRLHIMNLQTRQVLTAAKSLIEEGAEERHIEFYKKYSEDNKLPWPRPYDYFFGELEMSPGNQYFMSLGWAWGSYDAYTVYNTETFIESHRIASMSIGGGEHENRGACWIDDQTAVITYNPYMEGDDDALPGSDDELHFYRVTKKEATLEKKVVVKGLRILKFQLKYQAAHELIVCYSQELGSALLSLKGEVLYYNKELKPKGYSKESNLLYTFSEQSIRLFETCYSM